MATFAPSSSSSLSFNFHRRSTTPLPSTARVKFARPIASYATATAASSSFSLYQVLGLSNGATCQEIKQAYRRLARVCHPDVVSTDRKDKSADEFMKIHAAYSTLSDPVKRADYDRRILLRPRQPPKASGFSGYSGRTWETDQCW